MEDHVEEMQTGQLPWSVNGVVGVGDAVGDDGGAEAMKGGEAHVATEVEHLDEHHEENSLVRR